MFKKSLFLFLFLFVVQLGQSHAQKIYFWVDVGLKVDGGTGMHINQNLTFNNFDSDALFGSMYGLGAKFGFNFGEFHAFTVDGMYHFYNQKNNLYVESLNMKQLKELSYNTTDIYGMYRYSRNRNYIELGAKYSFLSKVTEKIGSGQATLVPALYQENMISPVAGIGFFIAGSDAFTTMLGFRLAYGLDDIVSEKGQESNAFLNPMENVAYEATNPLFIEFVLEFNFGLGYYAKSTCGKRAKFFGMDR